MLTTGAKVEGGHRGRRRRRGSPPAVAAGARRSGDSIGDGDPRLRPRAVAEAARTPGCTPRPGRRELPRDQMDPRLRPRRVSAGVDASRIPRCSPIGQAGGTCRGTRSRQCCGDIGKYVLLLLFCQCANSTVLHICHRSPSRRLLPPPHPLSSPTSSPGMTTAFFPPGCFFA